MGSDPHLTRTVPNGHSEFSSPRGGTFWNSVSVVSSSLEKRRWRSCLPGGCDAPEPPFVHNSIATGRGDSRPLLRAAPAWGCWPPAAFPGCGGPQALTAGRRAARRSPLLCRLELVQPPHEEGFESRSSSRNMSYAPFVKVKHTVALRLPESVPTTRTERSGSRANLQRFSYRPCCRSPREPERKGGLGRTLGSLVRNRHGLTHSKIPRASRCKGPLLKYRRKF